MTATAKATARRAPRLRPRPAARLAAAIARPVAVIGRPAAVIGCLSLAVAAAGCGGAPPRQSAPQRAAAQFFAAYARPDGRVVRPDQGGDTVSEGQAYGLLLAEAAGNRGMFGRIWQWTHDHLQRSDGLFAWRADAAGQVTGQQAASDADVLIAWALLRYQGPGAATRHQAGRRVASAILAHEVTTGPGQVPVLAAGPWAAGRPASLDPSYWSLTAFQSLAHLTGDPVWRRLALGAVTVTGKLTGNGRRLPPDWAELTAAGVLRAEPAPGGSVPQAQYGLDAQRTIVWYAASCSPRAKALAAKWWPLLRAGDHARALALRPDGTVLDAATAALPLVASASAATAAHDPAAARQLLSRAAAQQRAHPTYYGGAWDALGTVLLGSRALGTC